MSLHTIDQVFKLQDGETARIHGWVRSKSRIGGLTFAIIRDGTGEMQVAARKGVADDESISAINDASKESAVVVEGSVKTDPRASGGKEIQVKSFQVLAKAEKWPITKSAVTSPSFLYDN